MNCHLHQDSRLVTEGSNAYKFYVPNKVQHESVDHSKREWERGDVRTNTLEGFFSIFKRGLVCVYQAVEGFKGKRFTYRRHTKPKKAATEALVETVKFDIIEICNMRWIDGKG